MRNAATDSRNRVVAYLRVSTDKQADKGVSLDAQRAKVEAYATLYDLNLVAVVVDAGVSAKSLRRPGLARALAQLENGEADGLLVVKLDRLTRSVKDLGELLERYFDHCALLSVAENIDTRTAAGRLVLNVLGAVSQWERETTAERTKEALAHVKTEGATLGGEGLGWTRGDETDAHGRRVVREVKEEAETVERILALRAEGLTLRAIASTLAEEGRRTKRGGRWYASTVRAVLARMEAA